MYWTGDHHMLPHYTPYTSVNVFKNHKTRKKKVNQIFVDLISTYQNLSLIIACKIVRNFNFHYNGN